MISLMCENIGNNRPEVFCKKMEENGEKWRKGSDVINFWG